MAGNRSPGSHGDFRRLRIILTLALVWLFVVVLVPDFFLRMQGSLRSLSFAARHLVGILVMALATGCLLLAIKKAQGLPRWLVLGILLLIVSQLLRVGRNIPGIENVYISNNLSHAFDDICNGMGLLLILATFLFAMVDLLESRYRLARYEELLNSLPVAVYRNTPGPDGHFLEMNPAHQAMFEADSREQIMECPVSALYRDPDQRASMSEKLRREGRIHDEEVELVTLKGRPIWGSVTAILRQTDDGRPCFDGVILDITEKKLYQEDYRAVLANMGDGLFMMDCQGRFIDVNDAYCNLVGYNREELLGKTLPEMEAAESAEEVAVHMARVCERGHDRFETRHRCKDGSTIELEVTANFRDIAGGRHYVFVRDIRERKATEKALRDSEAKYRDLVQSANSIILRVDTHGRITFFNEYAQQFFGYAEEEILGLRALGTILPEPAHDEASSSTLQQMRQHPELFLNTEHEVVTRSGACAWVNWTTRPVYAEDGALREILCVGNDITERVRAQRVIVEQQAKIVGASRLSAVGTMASGIAHEINNPLAIISAAAEQLPVLLDRNDCTPDQLDRFCGVITRNISRISHIVRGLRLLARDGSADPFTSVNMKSLVTDTLELCRARFTSHEITLTVSDIAPELAIECRAPQVSQVLLNLLNNAYDAVERLPQKWVRLDVEDNADSVTMAVTDSGGGIPEDIADKVVVPFFTTKDPGSGIGLGLSISTRIAQSHGGELYIDRQAVNTRFVVRLPKQQPPQPA